MTTEARVRMWCEGAVCVAACTICGPLGVVIEPDADAAAISHMHSEHGTAVPA